MRTAAALNRRYYCLGQASSSSCRGGAAADQRHLFLQIHRHCRRHHHTPAACCCDDDRGVKFVLAGQAPVRGLSLPRQDHFEHAREFGRWCPCARRAREPRTEEILFCRCLSSTSCCLLFRLFVLRRLKNQYW